jgi:hypothetical protein
MLLAILACYQLMIFLVLAGTLALAMVPSLRGYLADETAGDLLIASYVVVLLAWGAAALYMARTAPAGQRTSLRLLGRFLLLSIPLYGMVYHLRHGSAPPPRGFDVIHPPRG